MSSKRWQQKVDVSVRTMLKSQNNTLTHTHTHISNKQYIIVKHSACFVFLSSAIWSGSQRVAQNCAPNKTYTPFSDYVVDVDLIDLTFATILHRVAAHCSAWFASDFRPLRNILRKMTNTEITVSAGSAYSFGRRSLQIETGIRSLATCMLRNSKGGWDFYRFVFTFYNYNANPAHWRTTVARTKCNR